MVKGAKKVDASVRGLGGAVAMMGEAAMRTAAGGGRDGITAAKFLLGAADLAPARKADMDSGEVRLSFSVSAAALPGLVAALASAGRQLAGDAPGGVVPGTVREVGETDNQAEAAGDGDNS